MTTLHLGVLDVPYGSVSPNTPRRVGTRRRNGKPEAFSAPPSGGETTGDIAEILEDKYHVMELFFELHGADIAAALEETMGDNLEALLNGAPPSSNSLIAATSDIEAMFKRMISNQELDSLGYPGIPTAAALAGVNHRLKHPYSKDNPERPSFRDTGLYQASFKAWMD